MYERIVQNKKHLRIHANIHTDIYYMHTDICVYAYLGCCLVTQIDPVRFRARWGEYEVDGPILKR